jgi:hypothetical protein
MATVSGTSLDADSAATRERRIKPRWDDEESWREQPLTVGLDVREGDNGGLPDHPGVFPEADVSVVVGPGDRADAPGSLVGADAHRVRDRLRLHPCRRVAWHERRKAGFDELGATMRELSEARLEQ